jgi:tRNA-splicing ligase RtcB
MFEMIEFNQIKKIGNYEWEISKQHREDMRADVRIFASQKLLNEALKDLSLEQAVNSATLPGIVNPMVVMPDVHQGYGFPIGGVAAINISNGVISPGAIGYDINCGVRLLASVIEYEQAKDLIATLASVLNQCCPSGVGVKGEYKINLQDLDEVCRTGARWALKKGYALEEDLRKTEESGCADNAEPGQVSKRAHERGISQLGTLGAGNHFIEVDVVDKIIDQKAANVMGLFEGCLVVQIHCGSRGFGHQICTDYVQEFQTAVRKWGYQLPDRELVCAPFDSHEGKAYFSAMQSAANFAFCNRQLLAASARKAFAQVFSGKTKDFHLHQVYDIAHNMGKIEKYEVRGREIKVCVHRKGATRAFGPGFRELPEEYQSIGQPVLVPGSMGTGSWVLVGTELSSRVSWGSCCHGAGRMMSRSKAKHLIRGETLKAELERDGIEIRAGSLSGLAEEAPKAYKDVDEIVEVVSGVGIARKVAKLTPLAVIKG